MSIWTNFGFWVLVVGIIVLIIGFIIFQTETINNRSHSWYAWALIALGAFLTIGGALVLVFTYDPN